MADMIGIRETVRERYASCIAGALTEAEFRVPLQSAGLDQIEIRQTHRVDEHASAAVIRVHKPGPPACCDPDALATCCEPTTKDACCGGRTPAGPPETCGCAG